MLVISESRARRFVSMGGCIGVRYVSNSRCIPTPSSSRVPFGRIVDAAAVEIQWLPTELTALVGIHHRFAVSPDVFYTRTISYSLSYAVCPCISSGAPSPVVLVVRFLLVCCMQSRTAHLSDRRRRILVWPFEALYVSSCWASEDKALVSSHYQTSLDWLWSRRVTLFIHDLRLIMNPIIDRFCSSDSGAFTFNSSYAARRRRHRSRNSHFNKRIHCRLIKEWSSTNKVFVPSRGQTMREWLSSSLVTRFIRNSKWAVYMRIDCCCLCVSGAAASRHRRRPRIVHPRGQLWDFAPCVVQRYTTSRRVTSWFEEWRSAHGYLYVWHAYILNSIVM